MIFLRLTLYTCLPIGEEVSEIFFRVEPALVSLRRFGESHGLHRSCSRFELPSAPAYGSMLWLSQ